MPRRRRWVPPAAVVVAGTAVALAVTRPDALPPAGRGGSPSSTPTGPSSSAPAVTHADLQPWPTAAGACGNEAWLPLLSVGPLRVTTGLTVLAGGAGLRLVDVDTGAARPIVAETGGRGGQVTELASSTAGVHAVQARCRDLMSPAGTVLAVDPGRLTAATALPGRVDALLSGPDTVWAFRYPTDPAGRRMVLRPVDGGSPVTMPVGFEAAAATGRDYLGSSLRDGAEPASGRYDVAAVSRSDPSDVRRLGRGHLVAATGRVALTSGDCDPDSTCTLSWAATLGGTDARVFLLPPGRVVSSRVVLSADGRRAAFQLSRPEPDARYDPGHPGGPSDLAVLDLRAGTLSLVPGVELAPKATAGLAFSRDGHWLLIALNEGRRARLLIWRSGLDRPMQSPARLPGRILYSVPVLDVTDRLTSSPR